MKIVFLDTETTDFRPGQICQLSYIICDAGELAGHNYFFAVDYMSSGAQDTHGFSMEYLSQFPRFKDCIDVIAADLEGALIVCHNAAFDINYLRTEFSRCSRGFYPDSFCTMRHFTNICKKRDVYGRYKFPSLEELISELKIWTPGVLELQMRLFGYAATAHDARFDATALCMCFIAGIKKGYLPARFNGVAV